MSRIYTSAEIPVHCLKFAVEYNFPDFRILTHIKYRLLQFSNMAAWLYAHFTDVTAQGGPKSFPTE